MEKDHPVLGYFLYSLVVLVISLAATIGSFFLVQDIAHNPAKYLLENVPPADLQYYILVIAGILFSTALSIVAFVALLTRQRVALAVWNATRWLATSREQFRRVYESAPIPYMMLSPGGEIHEPNKSALRFFSVTPEEIEGQNLFSFYSGETVARIADLKELYNRNIPINREEVQITTKDGAKRWVLLSVFEMRDAAASSNTGLATLFDITEQKQLDQAKTEFVSLASHQLRTPLATIKWCVDLLLSGTLDEMTPKQKEYMQRLYGVTEGMVELVDTLLNVSRIDMGTLPIELKPTNVREIADTILEEMSPQIIQKQLSIQKAYSGLLEQTSSDPKLLRIVLHNLISNAIKYTPQGGAITIRFEENGSRRISVSDTGYGVPKAQQERIFSKMFRADNVLKLPEQGTGLGLYLVKSVAERLGGSISFVSEENKGSTFTITF